MIDMVSRRLAIRTWLASTLVIASVVVSAQTSTLLTKKERQELDTFFSNFSEVGVQPFREGHISNDALIYFGVMHNYLNNDKRFRSPDGTFNSKISARYVDESVEKFFGRHITHHVSVRRNVIYKGGYYTLEMGEGEPWNFSQVSEFRTLGHNRFAAVVSVFTAPNAWNGKVHAPPPSWKDEGDGIPEFRLRFRAIIRRVEDHGRRRYILLDYQEQPN